MLDFRDCCYEPEKFKRAATQCQTVRLSALFRSRADIFIDCAGFIFTNLHAQLIKKSRKNSRTLHVFTCACVRMHVSVPVCARAPKKYRTHEGKWAKASKCRFCLPIRETSSRKIEKKAFKTYEFCGEFFFFFNL